jgi:hypothetical protein
MNVKEVKKARVLCEQSIALIERYAREADYLKIYVGNTYKDAIEATRELYRQRLEGLKQKNI